MFLHVLLLVFVCQTGASLLSFGVSDVFSNANAKGGELCEGVDNVADCLKTCYEDDACYGFDFDGRSSTCWLHLEDPTCREPQPKRGCTHYRMTRCQDPTSTSSSTTTTTAPSTASPSTTPVAVTAAAVTQESPSVSTRAAENNLMRDGFLSVSPDVHIPGGVLLGSFHSEGQCLEACLGYSLCLGVDYDHTDYSCWGHDSSSLCNDKLPRSNTQHFSRAICPPARSKSIVSISTGTNVRGGQKMCDGCSREVCLTACFLNKVCQAVDYNAYNEACYVHNPLSVCNDKMPCKSCTHYATQQCSPLSSSLKNLVQLKEDSVAVPVGPPGAVYTQKHTLTTHHRPSRYQQKSQTSALLSLLKAVLKESRTRHKVSHQHDTPVDVHAHQHVTYSPVDNHKHHKTVVKHHHHTVDKPKHHHTANNHKHYHTVDKHHHHHTDSYGSAVQPSPHQTYGHLFDDDNAVTHSSRHEYTTKSSSPSYNNQHYLNQPFFNSYSATDKTHAYVQSHIVPGATTTTSSPALAFPRPVGTVLQDTEFEGPTILPSQWQAFPGIFSRNEMLLATSVTGDQCFNLCDSLVPKCYSVSFNTTSGACSVQTTLQGKCAQPYHNTEMYHAKVGALCWTIGETSVPYPHPVSISP